jgi:hypothetical protein
VFRSYLTFAGFATIPARITHAHATTTNKSGCDEEQAVNQTRKERGHATHPQDLATTWHCCCAATLPPW